MRNSKEKEANYFAEGTETGTDVHVIHGLSRNDCRVLVGTFATLRRSQPKGWCHPGILGSFNAQLLATETAQNLALVTLLDLQVSRGLSISF